jgi:valyl-tRNA synthetase
MSELSKQYNPKETEDIWYKAWEENKLFASHADLSKKPFCIVIPPPNVTGILHMGHALNNTIQDILIRYHRMQGLSALWMPGTDHAGIATQNVVEKSLAKEGLTRQDLGREKFIDRVWKWKERSGTTIVRQLRKLGASCDWERERFTMDEEYSKSVVEVFVQLYEKGLIYQGNRIINWCPRCQTALSDEEAPHQDIAGHLYYLKYPVKEQIPPRHCEEREARRSNLKKDCFAPSGLAMTQGCQYVIVATTRPETMLGDTAVAVNPKDKRYKNLIGATLVLPLMDREIKVIADEMVDLKFGTGCVKVTPAHDPNDYATGKRHDLEFINCMHPDGRMNELAGKYSGMDRFAARKAVIEDLTALGLVEKIEEHPLSAGHCYRCHTIIEPYLSKQWFVKMAPLAVPALEAVKKGTIKFHPARWKKVYLNWMENIQDWCISRQIWWGHRLPVYYCKNCEAQANESQVTSHKSQGKAKTTDYGLRTMDYIIVSRTKPECCPHCKSTEIRQDEDVLDTWFSSWLWPFATFGWPFRDNLKTNNQQLKTDLAYFYPTSTLVTAPEIIFFWVARMIMAGYEFMGKEPFRDVYIHGTVRDIQGRKMSKSLGNSIDPLEIINEYGTDALRFSIISITAQGQDVFLTKERFEQGRNFCNKIWNASRFILMNLDPTEAKADLCVFAKHENLSLANRWILSRFYSTRKALHKNLEAFKFNEAANLLYAFFWHEFCDWYLEIIKSDIKNKENQVVMHKVLEKFLRMAHPFIPFITEEIWQKLPRDNEGAAQFIMQQPLPHVQEQLIDKKVEQSMERVFEIITAVRTMRTELEVGLTDAVNVKVCAASKAFRKVLDDSLPFIKALARVGELSVVDHYEKQSGEFVTLVKDMQVVIPLAGIIDVHTYQEKISKEIDSALAGIKAKEAMLGNNQFVKKAPVEIVEKEKARLAELQETLSKLKVVKDGIR